MSHHAPPHQSKRPYDDRRHPRHDYDHGNGYEDDRRWQRRKRSRSGSYGRSAPPSAAAAWERRDVPVYYRGYDDGVKRRKRSEEMEAEEERRRRRRSKRKQEEAEAEEERNASKRIEEQMEELEWEDEDHVERQRRERRKRLEQLKLKYEQEKMQGENGAQRDEMKDSHGVNDDGVLGAAVVNGQSAETAVNEKPVDDERRHEDTQTRQIAPLPDAIQNGDDMFDMFGTETPPLGDQAAMGVAPAAAPAAPTASSSLAQNLHLSANWDDEEGYLRIQVGEVINDRYRVVSSHGKGVFSTVVKALDLTMLTEASTHTTPLTTDTTTTTTTTTSTTATTTTTSAPSNQQTPAQYSNLISKPVELSPEELKAEVAIKIIRNNESMRESGKKEIDTLTKLQRHDPNDRCYCVQMREHFTFKNHLCIVFEPLLMDLREVLKKFGRDQGKKVGISIDAVRLFAKQLFVSLKHLQRCNILHADIKPDNILINRKMNIAKLSDFGSASDVSDNAIAPYLVSRFYRAPEIILGLPYSYPIDMWSIGCTLFELYTGKILFVSRNNNEALKANMELKGPFPTKLLKQATFRDRHFDHQGRFLQYEIDPITKREIVKPMVINKSKDLKKILLNAMVTSDSSSINAQDVRKRVLQLHDLLGKALNLDPKRRLNVQQALAHEFFR